MKLVVMFFCVLLILTVITASSEFKNPIVKTSLGYIRGSHQISSNNASILIFKSVPFAAPPIGRLRFRLPEPREPWSKIWDARKYSVACMSNSSRTGSPQWNIGEDCLYLNIFADQSCLTTKCPVIVYIHGGGFYYDSAVMFNDTSIIENFASQRVIFVIPAFRLGMMAMLNFDNENILPKNLGFYDIIQALRWIRADIRHFGGDPKQVTLMGHSTGGFATLVLTLTPLLNAKQSSDRDLFQQSIVMSAEDITYLSELSLNTSWLFAQKNKCAPEDSIVTNMTVTQLEQAVDCLRSKSAAQLIAVQRQIEDENGLEYGMSGFLAPCNLVPLSITDLQRVRRPMPMLTGTTIFEFRKARYELLESCVVVVKGLGFKNPEPIIEACHKRYDKMPNISIEDQGMHAYILNNARTMKIAGGDAYLYSYDDPNNSEHREGVAILLGVHPFEYNADQKVMAKIWPKYFTDFAKYGRPHKDWRKLHTTVNNYYSVNINQKLHIYPHNAEHFRETEMQFWLKDMKLLDWVLSGKAFAVDRNSFAVYDSNDTTGADEKAGLSIENISFLSYLLTFAMVCLLVVGVYVMTKEGDRRTETAMDAVNDERTYLFTSVKSGSRSSL